MTTIWRRSANAAASRLRACSRGSSPLQTVTSDVAEALEGVEVVFVVGPAYATEPFGADTRGHLHPGMTVVVCPSS
jgi:opine dehydrogenase